MSETRFKRIIEVGVRAGRACGQPDSIEGKSSQLVSSSPKDQQSISVNNRRFGQTRLASVSYSRALGAEFSLYVSGFKELSRSNTGVVATLNIPLAGRALGYTSVGRQRNETYASLGASRYPGYDGGLGWGVQANHRDTRNDGQAWAKYLGRQGEVTAGVVYDGSRTQAVGQLDGSLVLMGGGVHAGRRIFDSFALVDTSGIPDVPILHQNRVIGNSDSRGQLLVPDLRAYQENPIAIDPLGLPANVLFDITRMQVVPP